MSKKRRSTGERMETPPGSKYNCLGRRDRFIVSLAFVATLVLLSPSFVDARDGDIFSSSNVEEKKSSHAILVASAAHQKMPRQQTGAVRGVSDLARDDATSHDDEKRRRYEEGRRGRGEELASSPTKLRHLMSQQHSSMIQGITDRHQQQERRGRELWWWNPKSVAAAPKTTTRGSSSQGEEAEGADSRAGLNRNNAPISNQWRNAHNRRRRSIHPEFGKSFVRIEWDDSLSQTAQLVAQELLDTHGSDCGVGGEEGSNNNQEEQAFFSVPYGYNAYAVKEENNTPEEVLVHWVDSQRLRKGDTWTLNKNGSFTMAVWRPSTRLGCHTVRGQTDGTSETCYIHVCSYFPPGNCDITDESMNWDEMTFGDTSPCRVQATGA